MIGLLHVCNNAFYFSKCASNCINLIDVSEGHMIDQKVTKLNRRLIGTRINYQNVILSMEKCIYQIKKNEKLS